MTAQSIKHTTAKSTQQPEVLNTEAQHYSLQLRIRHTEAHGIKHTQAHSMIHTAAQNSNTQKPAALNSRPKYKTHKHRIEHTAVQNIEQTEAHRLNAQQPRILHTNLNAAQSITKTEAQSI